MESSKSRKIKYKKPAISVKQISSKLFIEDGPFDNGSNLLASSGPITCGPCGGRGCTPWTCS